MLIQSPCASSKQATYVALAFRHRARDVSTFGEGLQSSFAIGGAGAVLKKLFRHSTAAIMRLHHGLACGVSKVLNCEHSRTRLLPGCRPLHDSAAPWVHARHSHPTLWCDGDVSRYCVSQPSTPLVQACMPACTHTSRPHLHIHVPGRTVNRHGSVADSLFRFDPGTSYARPCLPRIKPRTRSERTDHVLTSTSAPERTTAACAGRAAALSASELQLH
eukprot:6195758-Pleurochrysis_carterae.AAC.3